MTFGRKLTLSPVPADRLSDPGLKINFWHVAQHLLRLVDGECPALGEKIHSSAVDRRGDPQGNTESLAERSQQLKGPCRQVPARNRHSDLPRNQRDDLIQGSVFLSSEDKNLSYCPGMRSQQPEPANQIVYMNHVEIHHTVPQHDKSPAGDQFE
jgi:hypothetical protein